MNRAVADLLQHTVECFLSTAPVHDDGCVPENLSKDAKSLISAVKEHIDCSHLDTTSTPLDTQTTSLLKTLLEAVTKHGGNAPGFFAEMLQQRLTLQAAGRPVDIDTQGQLLLLQICLGYMMSSEASAAVLGACVYARLLALPDALSYRVFHPNLLRAMQRAVDISVQQRFGVSGSKKRQRSQNNVSKPSKRSKIEGDMVEVEASQQKDGDQGEGDVEQIVGSAFSWFARALVRNKSLLGRVEAAELTKEVLDVLLMSGALSAQASQGTIKEVILELEDEGHTDSLLQRLLPILRISSRESSMRTFGLSVAKECFSKEPQSSSGQVCMPALKLLQHLSMDASDKADCRRVCASVIGELLESLPEAYQQATTNRFYGFLDLISQSKLVAQRCLAVEIACSLIVHGRSDDQDLLEILCSRSKDKISTVRVATLRSIGEVLLAVLALENEMSLRKGVATMLSVVKPAVNDAKPVVRKHAVKALVTLLSSAAFLKIRGDQSSTDTKALVQRCHDVSSSIRATAAEGLTLLLTERFQDTFLAENWVNVVMPCVMDSETSVRNKAVRSVDEIVFQRLSARDPLIWPLLDLLTTESFAYLTKAIEELSLKSFEIAPIITALVAEANTNSKSIGVWTMLEFLCMPCAKNSSKTIQNVRAEARKRMDPALISSLWSSNPQDDILCKVLTVAMGIAEHIPATSATKLAEEILAATSALALAPKLVQRCLQCLCRLCREKTPDEAQSREMIRQWGEQLLLQCADKLSGGLEDSSKASQTEVSNALFLAGELAILGFDPDDCKSPFVKVDDDIATLVMGFLAEENEHQERPESIRAYAIVATGKLCMVNKDLADRAIHMMIREMNTSNFPTVRANVMVILGDLCRRYTSLIDRHVDSLSASLCDPTPLVRRHAVIILTGLLQEDYIKWKSSLFLRFVAGIVDEDKEIASLVRYALTKIFPTKSPNLISGNFVEVVFALNGCADHDKYKLAQALLNSNEGGQLLQAQVALLRKSFANDSPTAATNRQKIYSLLLLQLADHQRLEVTNKLCRDVLGAFVTGKMRIPSADESCSRYRLFVDVFHLLCSPEIKVKASQAMDDDDEQAVAQTKSSAMEAAKRTVITKLERKNVIENVVPLLLTLYRKLQRERSGLIKFVVPYFAKLMKEHKNEVHEVLGAENKVVAEEIAFDLQKMQQAEVEAERQELLRKTKEAARRLQASSGTKRRKSLGALTHGIIGRTPIPSHKKHTHQSARRGSLAPNLTPSLAAALTKRPVLQPRTAPRLRAVENIPQRASTGATKKVTLKVTTASKLPKPWSVKQPKELPGSVRKDEEEGESQQDLTSTLMEM